MSEIISEQEYKKVPDKYKKWFTEVGKSLHFYCKRLTGVDFSIDEWNKAFEEVKNSTPEIQRLVLNDPPACEEQCIDCMATVADRRSKTAHL